MLPKQPSSAASAGHKDLAMLPKQPSSAASVGHKDVAMLPKQPSSAASPEVRGITYLDPSRRALVRLSSCGQLDTARMRPGAAGFAEACFEDEGMWIPTELPNLMLEEAPQISRQGNVKRKPAAAAPKEVQQATPINIFIEAHI